MKRLLCLLATAAAPMLAQDASTADDAVDNFAPVRGESPDRLGGNSAVGLKSYLKTQPDARALTLSVPAPRGQIVDRNGESFAQNVVRRGLAIRMPFMEKATDQQILGAFQVKLDLANKTLKTEFTMDPQEVIRHYKNRRWLPLVVVPQLPEEQARLLEPLEPQGIMASPSYLRVYPQNQVAGHIVGYVGRSRPLPTTEIEDGEPIFVETDGREGLEKAFDKELTGVPGRLNMIFAADGSKLTEEVVSTPEPGKTVVTTLDLRFQKIAENALRTNTRSGALVIIDCRTGDIRAMASWPSFDPNLFVPSITTDEYKKLNEDPKKPLFPRAYMGGYPPASTFKLIVSLGALQSGKIDADSTFDCPGSIKYGSKTFRNWHSSGEGSLSVVSAIKRSCNTWFYQVGLKIGARAISEAALSMGFGESPGLPVPDTAGFIPTEQWSLKTRGAELNAGDAIQMSIGQGLVLCSPLQAAQAMAGIGNGEVVPHARLVSQLQDYNEQIVKSFPITDRGPFPFDQSYRKTVLKGMVAVVNSSSGTGRGASISAAQVAGKTGTGQWKPEKNQYLAWFTGVVPAEKPLYAFAAIYEGVPGESVSGGKEAAPIVSYAFSRIFREMSLEELAAEGGDSSGDSKEVALNDDDDDSGDSSSRSSRSSSTKKSRTSNSSSSKPKTSVRRAAPAEPAPATRAAPTERRGGVRGFFRRMMGR